MRRDMDLIREILLELSKGKEEIELDPLKSEDKLFEYHIDILKQANLISYKNKFQDMVPKVYIDELRLTWLGNDYLDNISNESIWNKTKEVVFSKGFELGNIPFSIIKEITTNQIKAKIGLE